MDWKRVLFYGGIVILSISIMVGIVLFLRARNAPSTEDVSQAALLRQGRTQAAPSAATPGVPPFVPLSDTPSTPPWKEGDPFPETLNEQIEYPTELIAPITP